MNGTSYVNLRIDARCWMVKEIGQVNISKNRNSSCIYNEYNRQRDSPESLIITPPHLLTALVAIVAPLRIHGAYNKGHVSIK